MSAAEKHAEVLAALDAKKALLDAATGGPWVHYGDMIVWPRESGPAANDPICAGPVVEFSEAHNPDADAALIADLRNSAQAAIDTMLMLVTEHAPRRTRIMSSDIEHFIREGHWDDLCSRLWPCDHYRAAAAFAGVDLAAPTTQPAVPVVPSDGGGL